LLGEPWRRRLPTPLLLRVEFAFEVQHANHAIAQIVQPLKRRMWKCGHGKRSISFIVITEESSLELVKRLGLDQMDAVEDYLCHIAPIGAVCKHGSFGSIHTRARKPYIVSFSAPYPDAVNAANPYGFHREDLPSVIDSFLSAWAYKKSHPAFEVVKLRDAVAARFPAPILADRIERIEPVDDALLPEPRPRG